MKIFLAILAAFITLVIGYAITYAVIPYGDTRSTVNFIVVLLAIVVAGAVIKGFKAK